MMNEQVTKEEIEIIKKVIEKLQSSITLENEFENVIEDNFWDLIQ